MDLNYRVIATGSTGNAVLINDVMVDCGISFKRLKPFLYDVNYLLITHIHSDHVTKPTLKKIRQLFPNITVIGNYQVAQMFDVDIICNAGYIVEVKDYKILPFEAVHDVVCYGYTWEVNEQNIIYCTDTSSLENAPTDRRYDYLFIESNYDEKKIQAIKNARKQYGYDAVAGSLRHLSTKHCKEFYYMNRRNKDSHLIELHQSSRFY